MNSGKREKPMRCASKGELGSRTECLIYSKYWPMHPMGTPTAGIPYQTNLLSPLWATKIAGLPWWYESPPKGKICHWDTSKAEPLPISHTEPLQSQCPLPGKDQDPQKGRDPPSVHGCPAFWHTHTNLEVSTKVGVRVVQSGNWSFSNDSPFLRSYSCSCHRG
jgi:hypothetical protein